VPRARSCRRQSIEAADTSGWVVSITPSGGWIPAVIAGRTGIGVSQRAQQFVVDSLDNPFNVIAPGKRRRDLREMGYRLDFQERTSGPINAIFFDWKHGSFWGGSSNHGEDYGIAW